MDVLLRKSDHSLFDSLKQQCRPKDFIIRLVERINQMYGKDWNYQLKENQFNKMVIDNYEQSLKNE